MTENKIKIVLTGGHAGSTAYSLIQKILNEKCNSEIVFIGSGKAIEGKNIETLESVYFPQIGVKYIQIITGRIQRKFTIWTIPSLIKIPFGILHAIKIIWNEKPSIVVSFGGYAAFPVVVAAKLFGIPVIIHEQTAAAGRANIISAYLADKIALARPESLKYFPKNKCEIIGNPISNEVVQSHNKKNTKRKYCILIAGGSRGSSYINNIVRPIIPKLLQYFKIFHQTGDGGIQEFKNMKNKLPLESRQRYHLFSRVPMWEWYKYLDNSDILISRSGANIVSESMYLGIPSIFIPLPLAYEDEQFKNALEAKNLGLAEIFRENSINSDALLVKILNINKKWESIVKKSKLPKIDDSKASFKLLALIYKYAKCK